MKLCGLVIKRKRVYEAEGRSYREILTKTIHAMEAKLRAVEADRDAANKQIERLLHNGTEIAILWASIRQAGHEKQIRQVYDRLMGGK